MSDYQHGFVDRRSTCTNLVVFKTYIIETLEKGYRVDAIYTDFSKAFDSVDHAVLITKLKNVGFCNLVSRWILSYLSDRQQFVSVNGADSDVICVPSGVPQGSHLGPLLFLLFINDLPYCLRYSEIILYATDAKMFKIIKSPEDAFFLQKDLDEINKWCAENALLLNISKCTTITFSSKMILMSIIMSLMSKC